MPSLTETQLPLLERDRMCGQVPPRLSAETDKAYYTRLAVLYNLPKHEVETVLSR